MRHPTRYQTFGLAIALAVAGAAISGCKDDSASSRGASGIPELKAEPNPIPAGTGLAKTTVNWRTGDGATGQLYVSVDGRPEKKVAEGHRGKKEIDWIRRGKTYEFKLYQGESHEKVLASVTVMAPEAAVAGVQPGAARQPGGGTPAATRGGAAQPASSGGAAPAPAPTGAAPTR